MKQKNNKGITMKKEENLSEWFTQAIEKAEIVDIRNLPKGFMAIRPWGAMIIEKMYKLFEDELQKKGHNPTFMPSVIPEENLKKESSHIKGFTPEVFWLKDINDEKLALRPTSEALYTPMFKLWIRSYRDLPLKLYQRGSVFRLDTKATRPLIRTREILWIEAHDAFATKQQAEAQVQEDLDTSEKILHQKLKIPFLPMKRPSWDKFAGAEYTVAADVLMQDGKIIQQPSTHLMGQKFSKAFGAKFKDKKEKDQYLYTTAYGPAMSRILVSIIATHGDEKGLVLPSTITPLHAIIIPIYNKKNKEKILKECSNINKKINFLELKSEIDCSEKTPGEKFNIWELKGVPLRIEVGQEELKEKKITIFLRDLRKKEKIKINSLSKIKQILEKYDKRLLQKADKMFEGKVIVCETIEEIKKTIKQGKIAKTNFCYCDEKAEKCAEIIEKQTNAEIRGTLGTKKENASGNCPICGKKATEIVYIGKSY